MPSIRPCSVVLLVSLAIFGCAMAQNGLESPRLHMSLPPNISPENVEIRYVLYGAFGAYGGFPKPDAHSLSVEIPLAVEGKSADQIKAFVWAPGCRIARFDVKVDALDLQRSYSCEPSANILLSGQIRRFELLPSEGTEINVSYLAGWTCDFFGFADCMVPQFSIGTTTIDSAGTFELELPDFASDPACTGSSERSTFYLTLRDTKTKNPIARLSPESKTLRTPGGELRSASVYPNRTVFVANKPR